MDRDQATEIIRLLYATYPNFNKNNIKGFNQIWMDKLMQYGNYQKTLRKATDYMMASPYPPSFADIIVKNIKPKDDGMAEQIKQAEDTVKREKADPEKAEKRERLLNEMREKWGAYSDR